MVALPQFQILDWVSDRLPNLSFGVRTALLFFVILFSLLWAVYGWDSTVSYTMTGRNYGTGVHWSTGQTMALVMYIVLLNVQYRGIGPKKLIRLIRTDFVMFGLIFLLWNKKARSVFNQLEEFGRAEKGQIDGVRAVMYSAFVMIAGLFAFEAVWVVFYNSFHFGDVLWPIYWTQAYDGVPFYTYAFGRNHLALLAGLICAPLTLMVAVHKWTHYHFQYRLNRYAATVGLITLIAWGAWVFYPLPQEQRALESFNATEVINPLWVNMQIEHRPGDKFVDLYGNYFDMPAQDLFPQTSYTFYPGEVKDNVLRGRGFTTTEIFGFYNGDELVHGLNVAVKYLTMFAIAYPFMVKIR